MKLYNLQPSSTQLTEAQMKHLARFTFEALGIELTEGQPDTRQTKQTKINPEL
jgi:hypothetical protein